MDKVEGAFWLATQTQISFAIHLWATWTGFVSEKVVIVSGIN